MIPTGADVAKCKEGFVCLVLQTRRLTFIVRTRCLHAGQHDVKADVLFLNVRMTKLGRMVNKPLWRTVAYRIFHGRASQGILGL